VIIIALALACTIALATSVFGAAPVKKVLPDGLTVIVKPEPGSGIVAIEAFVKVGVLQEKDRNSGIGNLVARSLLTSTLSMSAGRLAWCMDEAGGNFETQWWPDATEIRVTATAAEFDEAMRIIGEVLTSASFEPNWVEQAKSSLRAQKASDDDDVRQFAYDRLRALLNSESAYGRPACGSEDFVKSSTPQDLAGFYKSYYVPNNIVISIAGDVTVDHAISRARSVFIGSLTNPLPKVREFFPDTMDSAHSEVIDRPVSVAHILVGYLAPGLDSPDRTAMEVAAAILGQGKSSRLFVALREKRGIGYDVGTSYPELKAQSHIVIRVVTDPYKITFAGLKAKMVLQEVREAVLSEIDSLKSKSVSEQELARAKQYLIGTYALKHQRLRERAFLVGWYEALGVGYDYDSTRTDRIKAITTADVQRVAKTYFDNYGMVVVLPKQDD
jgi:zinc protease